MYRIRCDRIVLPIIMKKMNAPPEVEVVVYNHNNSSIHYDDCFQNKLEEGGATIYLYIYV
jgi:hypothetical protein